MAELTERQRTAMAERVEEAKLHGVEMHGYEEAPWYWHMRFEGHGGRDFDGLWCDGEHLVQLTIDIYGNGYMSIGSVDWIHGGEDCECDACLAALADTDEGSEKVPSKGADLISAERERQITEEGWTPEHDKGHEGDLARAGASYALAGADDLGALTYVANDPDDPADPWPWDLSYWKPTGDAVRDLTKAGALIAAAIGSLLADTDEGSKK